MVKHQIRRVPLTLVKRYMVGVEAALRGRRQFFVQSFTQQHRRGFGSLELQGFLRVLRRGLLITAAVGDHPLRTLVNEVLH